MAEIIINSYELREKSNQLHIGDKIFLSGHIYTARDAAHKRIFEMLDKGEELPFKINDSIIYYAGPTAAPPGKPIGSCGPTTSSRMDKYTPRLLDLGLCAMIGKGERNSDVASSIVKNSAVYFCAVGGAGALVSNCIKSSEVIAFDDLGCESVKKLCIENMPLIVANDCHGGDIFVSGRQKFSININC